MRINIRAQGFELTDSLREHTERRLRYALSWADDHLRQVSVRLSSESSPRRSKNLRCRIQIDFPRAQDVVIEDTIPGFLPDWRPCKPPSTYGLAARTAPCPPTRSPA